MAMFNKFTDLSRRAPSSRSDDLDFFPVALPSGRITPLVGAPRTSPSTHNACDISAGHRPRPRSQQIVRNIRSRAEGVTPQRASTSQGWRHAENVPMASVVQQSYPSSRSQISHDELGRASVTGTNEETKRAAEQAEIELFATEKPSAMLAAMIVQAFAQLTSATQPQHEIMQGLISYIKGALYCAPGDEPSYQDVSTSLTNPLAPAFQSAPCDYDFREKGLANNATGFVARGESFTRDTARSIRSNKGSEPTEPGSNGILVVLKSALRLGERNGVQDIYCVCTVLGKPQLRFQTRVSQGSDAQWNHKAKLSDFAPSDTLVFEVLDRRLSAHDTGGLIGRAELDGTTIFSHGGIDGEIQLRVEGAVVPNVAPALLVRVAPMNAISRMRGAGGSIPFFVIVERQMEQTDRLHDRINYLQSVISQGVSTNAIDMGKMQSQFLPSYSEEHGSLMCNSRQGPSSNDGDGANLRLTRLVTKSMDFPTLVFMFGFWKVLHVEMRKRSRQKAQLKDASAMSAQLIKPFKIWHMYLKDCHVAGAETTKGCFLQEKDMLTVQMQSLRNQCEHNVSEIEMRDHTRRRLERQLQTNTAARMALGDRLERMKPDTLKAMFRSVLSYFLVGIVQEAKLTSIITQWKLVTREFYVLASLEGDEDLSRMAALPSDEALVRWFNYHLMQVKLVATGVLDAAAQAASELDADANKGISEWTQRDIELYSDRCKHVRGLKPIANIDQDLQDGTALTILYAALIASNQGIHPMDLWALDERVEDSRVEKIHKALQQILPTRTAKCLLRQSDIAKGNRVVLMRVLASLFVHRSKLPPAFPDQHVAELLHTDFLKAEKMQEVEEVQEGREAETEGVANDEQSEGCEGRRKLNAEAVAKAQIASKIQENASLCFRDTLCDISVLQKWNETSFDFFCLPPAVVLLRWVNFQLEPERVENWEAMSANRLLKLLIAVAEDVVSLHPSGRRLMRPETEDAFELEEWMAEAIVEIGVRCTSYLILTEEAIRGQDVQIIVAFTASLFLNRPGMPVDPSTQLDSSLKLIDEAVQKGRKYAGSILEFIKSSDNSREEDRILEDKEACDAIVATGSDFSNMCAWLNDRHRQLRLALRKVRQANTKFQKLHCNLQTFLNTLITLRAHGIPWNAEDEMEHRSESKRSNSKRRASIPLTKSSMVHELLSSERRDGCNPLVANEAFTDSEVELASKRMEEILHNNRQFFKEVFVKYATKGNNNAAGIPEANSSVIVPNGRIDLWGFARFARDCRFRNLKMESGELEAIFIESLLAQDVQQMHAQPDGVVSMPVGSVTSEEPSAKLTHSKSYGSRLSIDSPPLKEGSPAQGLSVDGFVKCLILLSLRCGSLHDDFKRDLSSGFQLLLDRHLLRALRKDQPSIFYVLAFKSGTSSMPKRLDNALKGIFGVYAKSTQYEEKLTTLLRKQEFHSAPEFNSKPLALQAKVLELTQLETMLRDGGVLVRSLKQGLTDILCGLRQEPDEGDDDVEGETEHEPDSSQSNSIVGIVCARTVIARHSTRKFATLTSLSSAGHAECGPIGSVIKRSFGQKEREPRELSFIEFLEFLTVVVQFINPNPFVPFMQRFEDFLEAKLFKGLWARWHDDPDTRMRKLLTSAFEHEPSQTRRNTMKQPSLGIKGKSRREERAQTKINQPKH